MGEIDDFSHEVELHPEGMTYLADGQLQIAGHVHSSEDMSHEEVKERTSEIAGVPPENISLGREEIEKRHGKRGTVGFNRWNSSWTPSADRARNAHLN